MIHDWQKNIEQYIPEILPGYDFVCRIPVYIPIQEIGMTVWERQVQSLSFIQECILSAVSIGAKDVAELSLQFGLPDTIILQIISQLDTEQLVAISAGNIILTDKGRKALQQQQKVITLRKQFSHIFVNQITGEITDVGPVGAYQEPPFRQVYLSENYPITLNYLRSQFETLAAIYQESRLERNVFGNSTVVEARLYRILDITYHTLSYTKEFCSVYLNQEDRSLAFRFQSGIQAYADTLEKQIREHENGAWNLLSQPPKPLASEDEIVADLLPAQLIDAIRIVGDVNQRGALIEEAYYQDRPLLDGEIYDILCNCHMFKAESIFIEAPYLADFLTDTAISGLLSQHTKSVVLHYDSNDRSAANIIRKIQERVKKQSDKKTLILKETSINSVKFYFGNACAIQASYNAKKTVYGRHVYKLCARVSFNSDRIQLLWPQDMLV